MMRTVNADTPITGHTPATASDLRPPAGMAHVKSFGWQETQTV